MNAILLFLVFVIDLFWPAPMAKVERYLQRWAQYLEEQLAYGSTESDWKVWLTGVLLPVLLVLIVQGVFSSLLVFFLLLVLLYLITGFKALYARFEDVSMALQFGDIDTARLHLANWLKAEGEDAAATQLQQSADAGHIARLCAEIALKQYYRKVFAVLFWLLVGGPAGVLLYRLSHAFVRYCNHGATFIKHAMCIVDWLPVRLVACGLGLAGHFGAAYGSWQRHSSNWTDEAEDILLATASGALGESLHHSASDFPAPGKATLGRLKRLMYGTLWIFLFLFVIAEVIFA